MSPATARTPAESLASHSSISEKQLEANRRNAQLSTGPRTQTGKSRTRLNAVRHGLTGHTTLMTEPQREAHDTFVNNLIAELRPIGALESNLAQLVAADSWRLQGASALEENIYALGHPDLNTDSTEPAETNHAPAEPATDPELIMALAHAQAFMAQPKCFQLLSLYEQRLRRAVDKNLKALRELQAEREAARREALEEVQLLLDTAKAEGTPCNPAEDEVQTQNGFVFSFTELKAHLQHVNRLQVARQLTNTAHLINRPSSCEHHTPVAPSIALERAIV